MQIQVETDNHIEGRQQLTGHVETVLREALDRFGERLTHVEAHLGDAMGVTQPGAGDKRCLLEARVAGVKSVAVSHQAPGLHQAIEGAVAKLRHALDSAIGKLDDRQRRSDGLGHQSANVLAQDEDAA